MLLMSTLKFFAKSLKSKLWSTPEALNAPLESKLEGCGAAAARVRA